MKNNWLFSLLLAGLLDLCSGMFGVAVAQRPVAVAGHAVDSNAIKTLFFAGLRDKLNENYAKAGESFGRILAMDPENAAANYEMAVISFRQNKLLDAEIAIKRATATDAENIWYWRLLAELYKRKGDMEALVKVFDQMIRIDPDDPSFYFDRSNAWLLDGKTEEARAGYDEIEEKFGNSEGLVQARQRLEADGQHRMQDPKVADQALTEEEKLLIAGEELYKKGDLNGALSAFQAVLKTTDRLYAAWEHTMRTQIALGLYKEAIKTGDEALSLYPSQAALYYHLATAQLNDGNTDDALVNIKAAMQLDEGNPVLLECYGDVLFLKGEEEAALLQWKKSRDGGNGTEKLKKKINEKKYIK